ncbi:bifunctional shikimate kinase/3-dehydroquinate synthase [Dethiosulfovibrio sp. F2B]|uniref:bifunctional shikimate kinase/3-dehydroquinate synthase n=1 Tax=Dethiosulfovibrio faecalis TaxID=2720018 RepID=UPI001F30268D|nr:bifunctional shikimate kinase/3-dehydroquinate synthase [Dethiosulfovibrio faecalis]
MGRGELVFLGGFMGSGKTSVGQRLAEAVGLPFVDLDKAIELRAGASVAEIFASQGEEGFRRLEAQSLREISDLERCIVALGGGALKDPKGRELIRKKGRLVILDASADTVKNRVAAQPGQRPLLKMENLEDLWERRRPLYSDGDLRVETDHLNVSQVAEAVREGLSLPLRGDCDQRILGDERTGLVVVGQGVLSRLPELLGRTDTYVVADSMTGPLFEPVVGQTRGRSVLPRGEDAKTMDVVEGLYDDFLSVGMDRGDVVLALGGGCVGDVAGFAAATWMRGIELVQCPTTLLAQVDSSIGGKVGVNLPQGKNLVGAFHRPKIVLSDVNCLTSLSWKDYRQGLGEVVKYGLGEDPELFDLLERNVEGLLRRDPGLLVEVVARCASIKLDLVSRDEREHDVRTRLNLGHTVAHGLEAASGYRDWSHGDAVAVGMVVATELSCRLGECDRHRLDGLNRLLTDLRLPRRPDRPWSDLECHIARDKKFRKGSPRLVLPRSGEVSFVWEGPIEELRRAYDEVYRS